MSVDRSGKPNGGSEIRIVVVRTRQNFTGMCQHHWGPVEPVAARGPGMQHRLGVVPQDVDRVIKPLLDPTLLQKSQRSAYTF